MKTTSPLKNSEKTHLKVIKNAAKAKQKISRIYINTLMPDFSYLNNLGKLIKPHKCIML